MLQGCYNPPIFAHEFFRINTMKQKLSASVFLLFFCCTSALTQVWSKEDSLWLQNVLEGKEIFKLNEDTKKAIEDGRLIVPSWMRRNNDLLYPDLVKEFDLNGKIDSMRISRLDPFSMPPAVFALYVLNNIEKLDSVFYNETIMISPAERKKWEELLPAGTRQMLYLRTGDYTPGFGIVTDFNHMLSMLFHARYRRIVHNSKHATAYKNYYDEGALKPIRMTELERRQIIRSVNSIKTSVNVSSGQRRGGIDD